MSDETRDTGGPAFPRLGEGFGNPGAPGMQLRDYFAAKAMAAMISTAAGPCLFGLNGIETRCTEEAYKIADAMLAARKK